VSLAEVWSVLLGIPVVGAMSGHPLFAGVWSAGVAGAYFGSLRVRPWWPSRCCGGSRRTRTTSGLFPKAYGKCRKCKNGEKLRWGVRVFMPGLAAREMTGQ
jgi:hypothetical protein